MMPAGNVEAWLGEVERRMKASIRTQVRPAANAAAVAVMYSNTPVHAASSNPGVLWHLLKRQIEN
jgi:hypothetical protein